MDNTINYSFIDNFMTAEECEHIIALRRAQLSPSSVVDAVDGASVMDYRRTSTGAWYRKAEFVNDPVFVKLTESIEALTGCPRADFEDYQILRYDIGQQYEPHHDYFADPTSIHLQRGGQRLKTALLYLNTPILGGDTYFPYFHQIIAPVTGRILVWDNTDSNKQLLEESMHGGMPVLNGEKYVLTCWIREAPFF